MRYFININEEDGNYVASLHQGNPYLAPPQSVKLGVNDGIIVKGKTYSLAELVGMLYKYEGVRIREIFDVKGQLDIGHYLCEQVFGETRVDRIQHQVDQPIDLRIITEDRHIASLPWPLMAYNGLFLSTRKWSFTIAHSNQVENCRLPDDPRLLIIAPEPAGLSPTSAKGHIENLDNKLSMHNQLLTQGKNIRIAKTWGDFKDTLKDFQPHVIYFYGHGTAESQLVFERNAQNTSPEWAGAEGGAESQLVFERNAQSTPRSNNVILADFAQALRELQERPLLVYVNCCYGDSEGMLGIGWQLARDVPAIITNRTITNIDDAQSQAEAILVSILNDGLAPHQALSTMYNKLAEMSLSFGDPRRAIPVLYGRYDIWQTNLPKRPSLPNPDTRWYLKLDRSRQSNEVIRDVRTMIREQHPKSLAFLWYGLEGQGIDTFHTRLRIELQEDLNTTSVPPINTPEWPMEYLNPERSFEDMLKHVLGVKELRDIATQFRDKSCPTLLYIPHKPLAFKNPNSEDEDLPPRMLRKYLQWWDDGFTKYLSHNQYALLTLSYKVENPIIFQEFILEDERIDDINFKRTNFCLLDEMERIAKRDLRHFIRQNKLPIPEDRVDTVIADVLRETEGHYENTIRALSKHIATLLKM